MTNQSRIANTNEPHTSDIDTLCSKHGRVISRQSNIYHQGDKFESFYRVNSGVVMVYRVLDKGLRQISGFYTAGEYFGFPSDHAYGDTAVTVATSNVACLPMSLVSSNPTLQSALFHESCQQLDAAQSLITTLTKKNASEKVAHFLLELSSKTSITDEGFDIKLPMSRLDIADYLGLTIETVSRRLTAFKSKGVISLPNRNTARIQDYKRLIQLAGAC